MTRNRDNLWRYILIGGIFIVVAFIYVGIFIDLQVSGQDYYSMTTPVSYKTRSVKIQAQRGEIYDRNGKKLIGNEYFYDLRLDYGSMPAKSTGKNDVILSLRDFLEATGETDKIVPPKYTPFNITVTDGKLSFEYNEAFFELTRSTKYKKIAGELNIPEDASADDAAAVFMYRYSLTDKEGELTVSAEDAAFLFGYRMDFDIVDFSAVNPYTFASDVSLDFIAKAEESGTRGFTVYCRFARVYNYPGYASHLLGRIQKIPAESVEYYTAMGYPLDAYVGTSGAEYAFEEYLHGVDGELLITEDAYGNIVKTEVKKEPIAGRDIYLTIDIGMQMAAEDALDYNIEFVKTGAAIEPGERDGEDAEAGALTAVDPDTGEVLVLASYPTYDLS